MSTEPKGMSDQALLNLTDLLLRARGLSTAKDVEQFARGAGWTLEDTGDLSAVLTDPDIGTVDADFIGGSPKRPLVSCVVLDVTTSDFPGDEQFAAEMDAIFTRHRAALTGLLGEPAYRIRQGEGVRSVFWDLRRGRPIVDYANTPNYNSLRWYFPTYADSVMRGKGGWNPNSLI